MPVRNGWCGEWSFGIIGAMATLSSIALALTLILCGGYAGMILMCQIGVLPAMRQLRLSAYAEAWRAMDAYMGRLMPPYKSCLLLINTVAVVTLALEHRLATAVAAGVSLILSVAGLVLTVRQQLPLNAKLKALPGSAAETELLEIREGTVRGFRVRFGLAAASFVILCCGVTFWPMG